VATQLLASAPEPPSAMTRPTPWGFLPWQLLTEERVDRDIPSRHIPPRLKGIVNAQSEESNMKFQRAEGNKNSAGTFPQLTAAAHSTCRMARQRDG